MAWAALTCAFSCCELSSWLCLENGVQTYRGLVKDTRPLSEAVTSAKGAEASTLAARAQ